MQEGKWRERITLIAMVAAALPLCVRAQNATPSTPDRPGRVVATDVDNSEDDALTEETARALGVVPPSQRIDQQLLQWGGLRPKLQTMGLEFQGVLTLDESKNFRGGIDTEGDAARYLLDLRFNLDTAAAFNFKGGTFSVDFQQQGGENGSEVLTGDYQGFNNADADGRTQIAELWYEQLLLDNRVRIKIGKVDANSEFALPLSAGGFVNSSYGHSPTFNPFMPTYPDASTSANFFYYPERWLYAGFGVYDGSGATLGIATGSYGPSKLFHSNRSFFYVGEVGVRWELAEKTLPGRFTVGGYYHDGDFTRFDGDTQSGASGLYVVAEQKLWHQKFYDKENENGIYTFFQYGHADASVSEATDHFGAGITWIGLLPKVNSDTIGVGFTAARLTDAPGAGFTEDWEVSLETFYNFQATPYLSIKPDLQYIIHPGGDRTLDDALVATLRVTIAF